MSKEYIITYDFGTSSLKAVLLDNACRIVGVYYVPYPTYSDAPGHMEQKVEDYWNSFCTATKALTAEAGIEPEQIAGMAMSQTTSAVILVDAQGAPLCDCIIWIDGRADKQAAEINARAGFAVFQGKHVPPKMRWMMENRPEIVNKAARLLDVSAYLFLRLTGEYAYDLTGAYGSQMLEDDTWAWSEQKLAWAGIPGKLLPDRIVGATDCVGRILPAAAAETGFAPGTPVFGGCSDNANGQIGTGSIRAGDVHLYIGSSSWFEITTDERDEFRGPYPSAMKGMRYHFRCTDTACSGVDAVLRMLYPEEWTKPGGDVYGLLDGELEKAALVPKETLFLPFLFGEQDPVADMEVRGTLLNVQPDTARCHILAAFVEGIAFNLLWMKEQQAERTGRWTNKPIRTYGGGAQSDIVVQIVADVLGETLVRLENPRTMGNVGLGVCVAIGLGWAPSFEVLDDIVREERTFTPDHGRQKEYARKYAIYRGAYEALKGTYRALNGGL